MALGKYVWLRNCTARWQGSNKNRSVCHSKQRHRGSIMPTVQH